MVFHTDLPKGPQKFSLCTLLQLASAWRVTILITARLGTTFLAHELHDYAKPGCELVCTWLVPENLIENIKTRAGLWWTPPSSCAGNPRLVSKLNFFSAQMAMHIGLPYKSLLLPLQHASTNWYAWNVCPRPDGTHTCLQPVLLSVPGSGNTMTRLLLDGVLAPYLAGSCFRDPKLFHDLPGE